MELFLFLDSFIDCNFDDFDNFSSGNYSGSNWTNFFLLRLFTLNFDLSTIPGDFGLSSTSERSVPPTSIVSCYNALCADKAPRSRESTEFYPRLDDRAVSTCDGLFLFSLLSFGLILSLFLHMGHSVLFSNMNFSIHYLQNECMHTNYTGSLRNLAQLGHSV